PKYEYTIARHDALPICGETIDVLKKHLQQQKHPILVWLGPIYGFTIHALVLTGYDEAGFIINDCWLGKEITMDYSEKTCFIITGDRKSTRLNSSHGSIS